MSISKALLLTALSAVLVVSVAAFPIVREVVCINTTYRDILVFFGVNFLAHAGTIPSIAGARWYETTCWTILALLFPFAGLGRSLGIIIRHLGEGKSDLRNAEKQDALLFVVRSAEWMPDRSPSKVYVELPKGFYNLDQTPTTHGPHPSASLEIIDTMDDAIVPRENVKIHGKPMLPRGYDLAYPNRLYLSEVFPYNSKSNENIRLCQSHSWLKMVISIAQLVYSSVTLYETRGDQLNRYGYAAFGLSVFPYTLMSLANLIVVGLVGEYPCLYILRTAIMNEAERRPGGSFGGAVGNCEGDDSLQPYGMDVSCKGHRWSSFTCATVLVEGEVQEKTEKLAGVDGESTEDGLATEDDIGFLPNKLVVTVKGVTRKFEYRHGESEADYVFKLLSYANQDHIPNGGYVGSHGSLRSQYLAAGLLIFVPLIYLLLPYVVIFALSGFKTRGSILAQRAWLMSWIASGQLLLLVFLFQYLENPHFRLATFSIQRRHLTSFITGNKLLLCLLVLAIPAVGGFIMVGKMLVEFGTCSLAPT
ncbi:hypothetical protein JAAARDRAFT_211082 [Jaapia argillacea MUCL 33604]|uniref:Uncharacterized protein n=1 Tax=Jaapia argillacea MUCL 33604 TaxID=933084 RepID=A0A067PCD6_9AGAM|nr:hypothetical protein JAAARDRAFT_211082 [Jaapia argillacea MUCL 33604]